MDVVVEKKPKKRIRKKKIRIPPEESPDFDPRRKVFAAAFYDPMSDTYGQLVPSGMKAGFTRNYSQNLTNVKPMWLLRIIEKMDLMDSVKRNIKKHLDLKTETKKKDRKGKLVIKEDPKLLKIQQDMTIFVAEKLLPEYKKSDKANPFEGMQVEIKQVIIMPPNADPGSKATYTTNPKTIPSLPAAN